jgi:hypothetical protein
MLHNTSSINAWINNSKEIQQQPLQPFSTYWSKAVVITKNSELESFLKGAFLVVWLFSR